MSVSDQKGFTLLEILIAIVLLAFITFGVVSVTENAVNTKDRTTATNANNLQIETAMSRFEWDFSQIYSPLYFSTIMNFQQNMNNYGNTNGGDNSGFTGQQSGVNSGQQSGAQSGVQAGAQGGAMSPYLQQYYEQLITRFERNEHFSSVSKEGMPVPRFYAPEKNVFEFFTTSNRRKVENQKQSHFCWVRYQLANQDQTKEEEENPNMPKSLKSLVRYVSSDDPYSDKRIDVEDIERVKGAVLLRNVESLEFQYWDFQKRKWESTLRSIPQGENVVRGIKVAIAWYDSTGNKRTSTRIFRTHWPLVVPQDQNTNIQAGVQSGVQAAAQAGAQAGTQAGAQAGTNSGSQSGINGGVQ
jgi:prepilin-type N-terminal cleavage/methylation domain-containing protein